VLNKPLWLHQRDLLARYCTQELEIASLDEIPPNFEAEMLVYRDNLFFDQYFIDEFIERARASGQARQVAFSLDDKAIVTHTLPLQERIRRQGDMYVADLWYFPHGVEENAVFQLPLKSFLSIENWVHVFVANCLFGTFSRAARADKELYQLKNKLKVMWQALLQRKKALSSSSLVQIGKDCSIDPTAVIQGPTTIGDNVNIEPGVVITQSIIGSNVSIMQGCQVQMSVIGDGSYLSFRAAVTFTVLMERCTVAQNACLQLCVVGRNSFIGAGNTFTDFNLLPKPIMTEHCGKLVSTARRAMGSCVGHNCRIGAGFVIYPGRMIESDTILSVRDDHSVLSRNVDFSQSHHHWLKDGELHQPQYPHPGYDADT
jgi:carbonic anhydrase/acetyltransferase-like protein (isoleucine patch superfamily)